ncbi:MAG: metallophosphoesterase [Actinobacteria bacterium]|nr:metallophosphoesterase [Actinomycetota bacterium]
MGVHHRMRLGAAITVAGVLGMVGCTRGPVSDPPTATSDTAGGRIDASEPGGAVTTEPTAASEPRQRPAVLVGAGDIASCESSGDEATAALLDEIDGTVATFGDNVYDRGTATEFARCYDPSWGRHRHRTRPAPGNHDYGTDSATAYFDYFGTAAGPRGAGYYSYDLGPHWHAIVLNSNCGAVGGCGPGSAQERWLRGDLAANADRHVVAYWHHARFSSGPHGDSDATAAFWTALYEHGAEIVLAGHDHLYERYAPLDPRGLLDTSHGIRQFVVGTGGRSLYRLRQPRRAGSEAASDATYGVIVLTLRRDGYDWEYAPVAGGTFRDAGQGSVHGPPGG